MDSMSWTLVYIAGLGPDHMVDHGESDSTFRVTLLLFRVDLHPQWIPSPTSTTQPITLHLYDYDWQLFTLEKTERNNNVLQTLCLQYLSTSLENREEYFHLISFPSADLPAAAKTTK